MHSIISNICLPTQELLQPTFAEELPPEPAETLAANDLGNAIANLLINEGHLTSEQLAYAQRVRSKLVTPKTLLAVLQELQLVTPQQLRDTLGTHRVSMPLGALLVELGLIRSTDLQVALSIQQATQPKKKLGEILVERHFIREQQLAEALSYQLGFPYVTPNFAELDMDLLGRAQANVYAERNFIPTGRRDGRTVVAFVDPLDQRDAEIAQQFFGPDIILAVATRQAIQEAIALYVQSTSQVRPAAPDEFSIIGMVSTIFEEAIQAHASDIHFEPMKDRLRVRFRRDGVLLLHKDFPKNLAVSITSRLRVLAKLTAGEQRQSQEGRVLYEDPQRGFSMDMLATFYNTLHGKKIVLRLLNKQHGLLDLASIGMAPKMLECFHAEGLDTPNGLVLLTGPARMGKTTTLYGCMNYLNTIYNSIITVEDPVEHTFDGITQCLVASRTETTHTDTLHHLVQQAPDVIVIGELHDHTTAEVAIQATLTGYKVLATLQTEDGIGGLQGLYAAQVEKLFLSSTNICLVAQRLLRKVCTACAEPYVLTPGELQRLGYMPHDFQEAQAKIGRGCPQCRFTGYQGRVGVFELLFLDEPVKEALLSKKTAYQVRRLGLEASGLASLFEDGIAKAARGLTSFQEVIRCLPRLSKPRPLRDLVRMLGE